MKALQKSFARGILSANSYSRENLQGYNESARDIYNFLIGRTGELYRRGGTALVEKRGNPIERIIPFNAQDRTFLLIFERGKADSPISELSRSDGDFDDRTEDYPFIRVLEMTDHKIKVRSFANVGLSAFQNSTPVKIYKKGNTGLGPFESYTRDPEKPFAEGELANMTHCQIGNVMVFVNDSGPPFWIRKEGDNFVYYRSVLDLLLNGNQSNSVIDALSGLPYSYYGMGLIPQYVDLADRGNQSLLFSGYLNLGLNYDKEGVAEKNFGLWRNRAFLCSVAKQDTDNVIVYGGIINRIYKRGGGARRFKIEGRLFYRGSEDLENIDDRRSISNLYLCDWSPFAGWPRSVTEYENRFVYGGSEAYPAKIWFSSQPSLQRVPFGNKVTITDEELAQAEPTGPVQGGRAEIRTETPIYKTVYYDQLDLFNKDVDALGLILQNTASAGNYFVNDAEGLEIYWIVQGEVLFIGTNKGVFISRGTDASSSNPVPFNTGFQQVDYVPVKWVFPVVEGKTLYFVTRDHSVRRLMFGSEQGYKAENIDSFSREIVRDTSEVKAITRPVTIPVFDNANSKFPSEDVRDALGDKEGRYVHALSLKGIVDDSQSNPALFMNNVGVGDMRSERYGMKAEYLFPIQPEVKELTDYDKNRLERVFVPHIPGKYLRQNGDDITLLQNTTFSGTCSDGFIIWFLDNTGLGNKWLRAYLITSKNRIIRNDINLGRGNFLGCTTGRNGDLVGKEIWVINSTTNKCIRYQYTNMDRISNPPVKTSSTDEITLPNSSYGGATFCDGILWVLDSTNKIVRAINPSTKLEISVRNIRLDDFYRSLGANWVGLASDERYIWVIDNVSNKAYAFDYSVSETMPPIPSEDHDIDLGIGGWSGGVKVSNILRFIDFSNELRWTLSSSTKELSSDDVDGITTVSLGGKFWEYNYSQTRSPDRTNFNFLAYDKNGNRQGASDFSHTFNDSGFPNGYVVAGNYLWFFFSGWVEDEDNSYIIAVDSNGNKQNSRAITVGTSSGDDWEWLDLVTDGRTLWCLEADRDLGSNPMNPTTKGRAYDLNGSRQRNLDFTLTGYIESAVTIGSTIWFLRSRIFVGPVRQEGYAYKIVAGQKPVRDTEKSNINLNGYGLNYHRNFVGDNHFWLYHSSSQSWHAFNEVGERVSNFDILNVPDNDVGVFVTDRIVFKNDPGLNNVKEKLYIYSKNRISIHVAKAWDRRDTVGSSAYNSANRVLSHYIGNKKSETEKESEDIFKVKDLNWQKAIFNSSILLDNSRLKNFSPYWIPIGLKISFLFYYEKDKADNASRDYLITQKARLSLVYGKTGIDVDNGDKARDDIKSIYNLRDLLSLRSNEWFLSTFEDISKEGIEYKAGNSTDKSYYYTSAEKGDVDKDSPTIIRGKNPFDNIVQLREVKMDDWTTSGSKLIFWFDKDLDKFAPDISKFEVNMVVDSQIKVIARLQRNSAGNLIPVAGDTGYPVGIWSIDGNRYKLETTPQRLGTVTAGQGHVDTNLNFVTLDVDGNMLYDFTIIMDRQNIPSVQHFKNSDKVDFAGKYTIHAIDLFDKSEFYEKENNPDLISNRLLLNNNAFTTHVNQQIRKIESNLNLSTYGFNLSLRTIPFNIQIVTAVSLVQNQQYRAFSPDTRLFYDWLKKALFVVRKGGYIAYTRDEQGGVAGWQRGNMGFSDVVYLGNLAFQPPEKHPAIVGVRDSSILLNTQGLQDINQKYLEGLPNCLDEHILFTLPSESFSETELANKLKALGYSKEDKITVASPQGIIGPSDSPIVDKKVDDLLGSFDYDPPADGKRVFIVGKTFASSFLSWPLAMSTQKGSGSLKGMKHAYKELLLFSLIYADININGLPAPIKDKIIRGTYKETIAVYEYMLSQGYEYDPYFEILINSPLPLAFTGWAVQMDLGR